MIARDARIDTLRLCAWVLENTCAVLGVGGAICVRPGVASVQSRSFNPAAFVEDESRTITTKYFGASGLFSSAEDRLVPRRHGADRVEGFPCRSHTAARAHTYACVSRTSHDPFFLSLLNSLAEVTRRPGDVLGFLVVFEGVYLASVTLSRIICYFVLGVWIFNNCARNSIRASSLGYALSDSKLCPWTIASWNIRTFILIWYREII